MKHELKITHFRTGADDTYIFSTEEDAMLAKAAINFAAGGSLTVDIKIRRIEWVLGQYTFEPAVINMIRETAQSLIREGDINNGGFAVRSIKMIRQLSGAGLKESKDFFDVIRNSKE